VKKKIIGRDVTPYVLKRVAELTRGESLKANIALVKNNAKIGAEIAKELARLRREGS
jgi:pseudouridine-5'-phosphate glycosidase